jgi:hypothetical protein
VRGGANALFLTVSTGQQKEQLRMMQVYPRSALDAVCSNMAHDSLVSLQNMSMNQLSFMQQASSSQLSVIQNM